MFDDYETMASVARRMGDKISEVEAARAVAKPLGWKIDMDDPGTKIEQVRIALEGTAYYDGKPPVFKCHKDIALTLAGCEFNIDSTDIKFPFPSFIISLESGTGIRCERDDTEVRTILCIGKKTHGLSSSKETITFVIQSSLPPNGERHYRASSYICIGVIPGESLEQTLTRNEGKIDHSIQFTSREKNAILEDKFLAESKRWLRVAIGVALLATSGDKLVGRDILSADLLRYIEAKRAGNAERARQLEDRCERRRKGVYFTVGRMEVERQLYGQHGEHEPGDRHLSAQHIRRAHFRKLESGKVVFVRMAVIRPDLPARGEAVSYQL